MAKESDKIRLPELPIFKKYSLAVRQEYVTPQEVLAALERTTARVERLMEKAEEDRRRREEAERGEAERLSLEEQERQWAVEPQEIEEHAPEDEDIPGTTELEKAEEVVPLDVSSEDIEPEYERPFWEVDEEDLEDAEPAPEPQAPLTSDRMKPRTKKAKPRPKPQIVQVSHRGKPIIKKASSNTASGKKSPAKKKTVRTSTKRKAR